MNECSSCPMNKNCDSIYLDGNCGFYFTCEKAPEVALVIINMTPHQINICDADGQISKTIPASGQLIRLAVKTVPAGNITGIPLSKSVFGKPEGLPEYRDGIFYIVSQLVKSALPGRTDLLVPAEMVRNADGQIVGCRSLGV